MNLMDLTGQKYTRLTVIERKYAIKGEYYWLCRCDCGNETIVRASKLKRRTTKSCGCLHKDIVTTNSFKHGMSRTRLYRILAGVKNRCLNQNVPEFKHYGGRGITICEEWKSDFMSFYNWAINNGYSEHLTLDRINNDGHYEPNNCRWISQKEQCNNTRKNNFIECNGEIKTLSQWSEITGINKSTLASRIRSGYAGKEIFREVERSE